MSREGERILLVRLSSMGDIVLATPVAERLRRQNPDAHLTWLVDAGYRELLLGLPWLDRVIEYDWLGAHRGPAGLLRLASEIGQTDRLIDLQHKVRSVVLSALLRPGERRVLVKRRPWAWMRAAVGKENLLREPHQVERFLSVIGDDAAPAPVPRLVAAPARLAEARSSLGPQVGSGLVGMVVGARHLTKRPPLRMWVETGRALQASGCEVLLVSAPSDTGEAQELAARLVRPPRLVFHGTELDRLVALLACCRLVVSPDSGPAHVAAALGVPLVVLFGPTAPERWIPRGPLGPAGVRVVRRQVPCSPCSNHGTATCPVGSHECLQQLPAPDVVEAALGLLAGGAGEGA